MAFIANLGESSVDITARGWTNTADFWAAFWDLSRRSKTELEAAGFSIPFPQRDLHLKTDSAEARSAGILAKAEASKPAPRARATTAKAKTTKAASSKADSTPDDTTDETKA
jgi:small conductance mechanosensitive channel